jgi:hypothetical protein
MLPGVPVARADPNDAARVFPSRQVPALLAGSRLAHRAERYASTPGTAMLDRRQWRGSSNQGAVARVPLAGLAATPQAHKVL